MENAERHEEATASDVLKHEITSDEVPVSSENNGEHNEAASAVIVDNKEMFDGEQPGDTGASVDELNLDHQDRSAAVNGEESEDIQNDVVPHESSESVSELEGDVGAVSRGEEEADVNASDFAETEEASNVDNVTTEDAETEEKVSDEHSDLHDAGPSEPTGEATDDAPDTDVVDAPSPMDVDAEQPAETERAAPDAGHDSAMEIEYATCAEEASSGLVPYSSGSEKDGESPMAEDKDDTSQQSYHEREEKIADSGKLQDSENIASQTDASEIGSDLQDSDDIAGQADAAEYDEVDTSQSKVEVSENSQSKVEASENSKDLNESGNVDGLVEGDDFTVELQPDMSELDSTAEVDQPQSESEATEKAGMESDTLASGEFKKTSDDAGTAPPPISSDLVCISCITYRILIEFLKKYFW